MALGVESDAVVEIFGVGALGGALVGTQVVLARGHRVLVVQDLADVADRVGAAPRGKPASLSFWIGKLRALPGAPGHVCFSLTEDLHGCRSDELRISRR